MLNLIDRHFQILGIFLILVILVGGGGIIYKEQKSQITNSNPQIISNDQNSKFETEKPRTGLVNINIASQEELESLPGIGPNKARAVIDYRIKYGNFKNKRDIIKVRGIGEKTYEKIKNLIEI